MYALVPLVLAFAAQVLAQTFTGNTSDATYTNPILDGVGADP